LVGLKSDLIEGSPAGEVCTAEEIEAIRKAIGTIL
jgi:hypothetical protein